MLNFGIIYGMSDFGLAWRMGMPREEAQRFIDEYFKRYAQVRRYIIETKSFCAEQGYVETLLGRRRYIADMTSRNSAVRNAAERMAINMPIQGTAADIMKIAMRRVYDRLAETESRARVMLQVHDELVVEVPRDAVDATAADPARGDVRRVLARRAARRRPAHRHELGRDDAHPAARCHTCLSCPRSRRSRGSSAS